MDAHGTQFDYDDEFVDVVPLDAERSPGDEIVTMIGQIAAKPAAKAMRYDKSEFPLLYSLSLFVLLIADSIPKAYFTIFKSFIGAGVLYLPNGFSHGGILVIACCWDRTLDRHLLYVTLCSLHLTSFLSSRGNFVRVV